MCHSLIEWTVNQNIRNPQSVKNDQTNLIDSIRKSEKRKEALGSSNYCRKKATWLQTLWKVVIQRAKQTAKNAEPRFMEDNI